MSRPARIVLDGIDDERILFSVQSESRPNRWYVVTVRRDNGNCLCGYRLEDDPEVMEGCEDALFRKRRGNLFRPLDCCKHVRAVIERLGPLLNEKSLAGLNDETLIGRISILADRPSKGALLL